MRIKRQVSTQVSLQSFPFRVIVGRVASATGIFLLPSWIRCSRAEAGMGFAWLAVKAFSLCFAWLSLHVKDEERCGVSSYGDTIAFQGPPSWPLLSLTMFQRLQLNISHQQLELQCILNTKFAILISMPNTFNIAVSNRLCVTCDMYLSRRGMHGCFWGQAQWRERSVKAKILQPLGPRWLRLWVSRGE